MKHFFRNLIRYHWPIFALLSVVSVLFATNYIPNTYLTGWDNLHPEFNFGVNIKRSIFAVWQQYQGLGLLGGMGHASDLVHQIVLLILSIFLPLNLLRYFWTFLMLFAGSVGAYYLIRFICHPEQSEGSQRGSSAMPQNDITVPLLGALFYLLNLATLQTFYTPFEAFTAHFATMPWLLLTTLLYFIKPNKKHLLFFVAVLLLATPLAYIPTLFVTYLMSTGILLLSLVVLNKMSFKRVLKIFLLIVLINAFWLLPFFYFTATNASVALNAKINQMATQTIFLQNKEFGGILDVVLLKGFWFQNVEPNKDGVFTYMLAPYKTHLANPFILAIGYLFFAVIVTGVIGGIREIRGNKLVASFVLLFLFAFTMLATATPPFSWLDVVFRKLPLFEQAFRFSFTKFATLTALTYSIFFAVGIGFIASLIGKKRIILFSFCFLLFAIFSLPAFQGHLFYEKERLAIPNEYFQLFEFFRNQDKTTRIANLPQHTFWGWNYYQWGYGGSGFLWYGIEQPIMDRAFDVWSKTSENYYFELSHALFSKDAKMFESVLNKYQITWLLVDKNIMNPSSSKSLFFKETENLLLSIPRAKKIQTFGNIDVYHVDLSDNIGSFVFFDNQLSKVNGYSWSDYDQAYQTQGNYLANFQFGNPLGVSNFQYFPFRTLFSGKNQEDEEFNSLDLGKEVAVESVITNQDKLKIPSFAKLENIIPLALVAEKTDNATIINAQIQSPKIILDGTPIWGGEIKLPLFSITSNASYPLHLNVNGAVDFIIQKQPTENQLLGTTFLTLNQDNIISISDKSKNIQTQTVSSTTVSQLPFLKEAEVLLSNNKTTIRVSIPKLNDGYLSSRLTPKAFKAVKNCDLFRNGSWEALYSQNSFGKETVTLSSRNATACTEAYLPSLIHDSAYMLTIVSNNIKGRSLHVWLLDEDTRYAPIDTYLPSNGKQTASMFVLAPYDEFGKAYSLHMENVAIGSDETQNTLEDVSITPFPYRFITSIQALGTPFDTFGTSFPSDTSFAVSHPNESLYLIQMEDGKWKMENSTLVLSQSYDPGWKAYQVQSEKLKVKSWLNTVFPFVFGKELQNHVLVNNWENGWIMNNYTLDATKRYTFVIIYLPQYLEYLGFILLISTLIFVLLRKNVRSEGI